jgi:hypothetical protein
VDPLETAVGAPAFVAAPSVTLAAGNTAVRQAGLAQRERFGSSRRRALRHVVLGGRGRRDQSDRHQCHPQWREPPEQPAEVGLDGPFDGKGVRGELRRSCTFSHDPLPPCHGYKVNTY